MGNLYRAQTNLYAKFGNTLLITFIYTRFLEQLVEIWQFPKVQKWQKMIKLFFKSDCGYKLEIPTNQIKLHA